MHITPKVLIAIRRQLFLTQRAASIRAGIDPSEWSRYERGKIEISKRSAAKIRDAFGPTLHYLERDQSAQIPIPDATSKPRSVAPGLSTDRLDQIEATWTDIAAALARTNYDPNQAIFAVGFASSAIPDLIAEIRRGRP